MPLLKTPVCDFGKKAESFKLKSINNELITLNDIKGKKATLIMFICNHCPYVKAIIKYLTKDCQASIINNPNFKNRTQKIRDDRHGPTSWISITITEGKFRQVRKMTAAVGFPTLRLIRVRIGEVLLEGIDLGEVKEVKSFV